MSHLCCMICRTNVSTLISLDICLDSQNTISGITRRLFPFLSQYDNCNVNKICYSCSFYVNLSRLLLHTVHTYENLTKEGVTSKLKCDLCFEIGTSTYNSWQYPGNQYFDVLKKILPLESTINKIFRLCHKCKYHLEGWIKLQGIAACGILSEGYDENGSPEELENRRLYKHITMKRKGGKLVRNNSVAALHRTYNKPSSESTTSATKGLACRLRSLSVPLTDIIKNNSVKYQLGFEEEEHGVWKFKPSTKQNATRYHKQKSNVAFKEDPTMRIVNKRNLRTKPVIDSSLSGVESQNKSEFTNKPSVQSRSGRVKSTDSTVSLNSEVVLISRSKVHTQSEAPRLSLRSSKNKLKEVEQVKPLKSRSNNNCVQNNRSQEANLKLSRGHRSSSISCKTDVEQKFDSKTSLNTDSIRKSPRNRTTPNPQAPKNEKTPSIGRLGARVSDTKVVKNVQEVVRTVRTPRKSKSHEQLSPVKDTISPRTLSLRNTRKRAVSVSVDKPVFKKLKVENVSTKKKLSKRKQSDISNKSKVEVKDTLYSDIKLNRLGIPYTRTPRKRLNKVKMGWCNICGIELDSVENKLQHEFTHQESRSLFVSLHRCNLSGPSVKLPVYVDCKEVAALKSPQEDVCTSTDDSYNRPILEVENVLNDDECDAYEDYSDSEEENQSCTKEKDFLEEATSEVSQCNMNEESFLGDTSLENVTKVDQSLLPKSPKKPKKKGHVKMRLWENTQPQTTRCGRVVKLTQKYEEHKLIFKKSAGVIDDEKIDEPATVKIFDSVNSSQEEVLNDYVEVVVAKENVKKSEELNETEENSQESVISCDNQELNDNLLKKTNEQTTLSEEIPSEKSDVLAKSNEGRDREVTEENKISDDEPICTEPSVAVDHDACEINGSDGNANEENVEKTVVSITRPSIDLEDADTQDTTNHVLDKTCEIKDKDQFVGLKKKVGIINNDSGKVANDSDVPKNSELNVTLEDSNIQSNDQDDYDTEKAGREDTLGKSNLKEVETLETVKSNKECLTKIENGNMNATDEVESKVANESSVNDILEDENDEEVIADCSSKVSNKSEAEKITENENSNISDADAPENNCSEGKSEKPKSRNDDHLCTNQDGLEDISDEEFDFNEEEILNKNVNSRLKCVNEGKEKKAEDLKSVTEGAGEDEGEEQSDNLVEEDNLKMGDVGNDGRIAFQMALESVEAVLEEEGSGDKSECLENDSEEFYQEKVKVGIADGEFENVSVEEEEEEDEEEDEEVGVEDIEKAEIAEKGGGEDFDEDDKDDNEMRSYLGEKTMDETKKDYANISDGGMELSAEKIVGATEDAKEVMEGCNKIPVEMADVDDSSDPDHCISSDKLDSVILGRKYDETECSGSDKEKEGFVKANDVSNDNIVCVDNEDKGNDGCDIEGYDGCAINGITDIVNAPLPFEDVSVVTSVDRYTEGKDKTVTECEG